MISPTGSYGALLTLIVVEERVHKDLRETVGHAIPKPTGREQTSNEIPVTYAQPSSCRYVTCLPQLGKCLHNRAASFIEPEMPQ